MFGSLKLAFVELTRALELPGSINVSMSLLHMRTGRPAINSIRNAMLRCNKGIPESCHESHANALHPRQRAPKALQNAAIRRFMHL
jgi:hypothetical protein